MKPLIDLINTLQFNDNCSIGMAEDKVKVDRHKLAEMLQDTDGRERAQLFFEKIMNETNTQISWPTQLKTGGKSKRDAYVKIYGTLSSITAAKDKILEVLNIESKNLILKMDVSYDHHSHMIGKDGHNIQQIMNSTGCHIHFPDSNRTNMVEKSNQVSISGNPDKAQEARRLVRDSMPIVVKFEIPITRFQPHPDTSGVIAHIQQTYGIIIRFHYICNGSRAIVEVRGSRKQVDRFSQGLTALTEYLTGTVRACIPFFLTMQISVQHHAYVKGQGNTNIQMIMQQTNSVITFPEPCIDGANESHKMAVEIMGSFDSVYQAWEKLMDCLPFVMIFDLKDGYEIQSANFNRILEPLNITVGVRQKSKQNQSKVVILKSPERQAETLFKVRKLLLREEVFDHEDIIFSSHNILHNLEALSHYIPVPADPKLLLLSALSPCPVNDSVCDQRILPKVNVPIRVPHTSDGGSTGASTVSSPSMSPRNDIIINDIIKASSPPVTNDNVHKDLLDYWRNYDCRQSSDNFQKKIDENMSAVSVNHRVQKHAFQTEHNSLFSNNGNSYNEEASHLPSSSRLHPSEAIWGEGRRCTSFDDYELKKHLAKKAMKSPVGSEMRVPTDVWSGCGFSKSMPPSVIKNKLLESTPWAVSQSPFNFESVGNIADDSDVRYPSHFRFSLGRFSLAGNGFLSSSNCFDAISLRPTISPMSELGDLPSVLVKLGLEDFVNVFQKHEIDLPLFLSMNDEDLEEVGIEYCHRQTILHKISELKQWEKNHKRVNFEAAPGAERSLYARLARQSSSHQKS